MSEAITAIILAAGQGSRFRQAAGVGQDKLLAACQGRDGVVRPVLEQVLRGLPEHLGRRVLVTTADRPEVIRLGRTHGCQVLLLASTGMGDSIAAGVNAAADAAGWLMVLGDMPFILPETFEQVLARMTGERICVPVLAGEYGHPVGFGREFGTALQALSGDRGAKALFASGRVEPVLVEDRGILWDVDLPTALVFDPEEG